MSSTYVVKDKGGAIVAANVTKKVMLETVRGLLKSGKMKYRGINRWNVPKKDDFNKMFDASRIIKGRVTEMTVADPTPEEPVVKAQTEHKAQGSTKATAAKKGFNTIDEDSAAMDELVTQVLGTDTPDTFNDLLNDGKGASTKAGDLGEWQNDTSFLQELIEDAEQHIDNILIDESDFTDAVIAETSESTDEVVVAAEDADTIDFDFADDGDAPSAPDDEMPEPAGADNSGGSGHDIFDDIADFRKRIEDHLNANTFDASGFDQAIADESAAIESESTGNDADETFEDALASVDMDIDETIIAVEDTEFDEVLTPFTIDDDFGGIFSFAEEQDADAVVEETKDTKNDFIASAKTFVSDVKLDIEEKVEELRSTEADGTPAIAEKLDTFTDAASEKIDEGTENIKEKFEHLAEKFEKTVPDADKTFVPDEAQTDATDVDDAIADDDFIGEDGSDAANETADENEEDEETTDGFIDETDITDDEDSDEVVEADDEAETADDDDYDYDDDLVYRGDEPIDEVDDTETEAVAEDIDEPITEYEEGAEEELAEDLTDDENIAECDDEVVEEEIVEDSSYDIGDSVADTDGRFLGTVIGIGDGVVFLPVEGDDQSAKIISMDDITAYEDSMENIIGDIDAGGFDIEVLTARFREFVKAKQR